MAKIEAIIKDGNEMSLHELKNIRPDVFDYVQKMKKRLGNNLYAQSIKYYKSNNGEIVLVGHDDRINQKTNYAYIVSKDVYCWPGNSDKDGHLNEFLNNYRMIPNSVYHLDNANYFIDEIGRVKRTIEQHDGSLPTNRNEERGNKIDISHMKGGRYTDVGGHIVAHNIDGASEAINIVPMDKKFNNRDDWKRLENKLKEAYSSHINFEVQRELLYDNDSLRPEKIIVKLNIDGNTEIKEFQLS